MLTEARRLGTLESKLSLPFDDELEPVSFLDFCLSTREKQYMFTAPNALRSRRRTPTTQKQSRSIEDGHIG